MEKSKLEEEIIHNVNFYPPFKDKIEINVIQLAEANKDSPYGLRLGIEIIEYPYNGGIQEVDISFIRTNVKQLTKEEVEEQNEYQLYLKLKEKFEN